MSYKETLDRLSLEISSLQVDDSVKNMRVYKNNIFNLVVSQLKKDYVATEVHLGESNFIYFARKMYLKSQIKSPNINMFLRKFASFLKEQEELSEDRLTVEVAQVDYLWSYKGADIVLAKGIFKYWSSLINGEKQEPNINWDTKETVFSFETNGERYLSAK